MSDPDLSDEVEKLRAELKAAVRTFLKAQSALEAQITQMKALLERVHQKMK